VHIAVGEGGPSCSTNTGAFARLALDGSIEIDFLPVREPGRLALDEIRPHGEIGLRELYVSLSSWAMPRKVREAICHRNGVKGRGRPGLTEYNRAPAPAFRRRFMPLRSHERERVEDRSNSTRSRSWLQAESGLGMVVLRAPSPPVDDGIDQRLHALDFRLRQDAVTEIEDMARLSLHVLEQAGRLAAARSAE